MLIGFFNKIDRLRISLENAIDSNDLDGVSRIEKEEVYWIKNIDPSFLANLEVHEHQEQYQFTIPKQSNSNYTSRVRVRCINDEEYVLTIKANEGDGDTLENNLVTTKEMFDLFKKIAGQGMKKKRYKVPKANSNLVWEIDIFELADGSTYEWAKIDLEFFEGYYQDRSPLKLHIPGEEYFTAQWGKRTPEEIKKFDEILKGSIYFPD